MGEIQELKRRIAELEKQEKVQHLEGAEMPCEVTVGMLTFNSIHKTKGRWRDVVTVLWHQGLPLQLIVADNGSAPGEGTVEVLRGYKETKYLEDGGKSQIRSFRYLGQFPHQADIDQNTAFGRAKIIDEVETEYVFWLDDDVLLLPGDLCDLLEEFKAGGDKLGALGIPYSGHTDHVQQGALLMHTEAAREIGFDGRGRCCCVNLAKALADRQLAMRHWQGGFARHVSREV